MSWPTWSATSAPIPTAMATPVQSTLVPTAINSAPAVIPPGIQYSPEQWAQAQQQNWQQWAQWQQQYQQWHQQYGAEYQKSISTLQGLSAPQPPLPTLPNTGVPPPLPAEPKPPLPPEDPPTNQQSVLPSYTTAPPNPMHAGYSTAPPPVVAQQMQMPAQLPNQYNVAPTWHPNQNKRPYTQNLESEPAKKPLLERPQSQWGNQKPNVNQWPNQAAPNVGYNQPPPLIQPQQALKPNIEELSEAEKKFDKEFAAWEAQFNKWKDQNANHPDKTQYMEYEKKWESWRNSLLERREQMRRKRLAMTNTSTVNKPSSGFPQMSSVQPPVAETKPVVPAKLALESPSKVSNLNVNLSTNSTSNPLPHLNNEPLSFKPAEVSPREESGEGFLKSSATGGGIPGLDLVKDDGIECQKEEAINLDKEDQEPEQQPLQKGPDLDAISKGINTILGDQKLLSMLSMVSQNPPSAPPPNTATNSMSSIASSYPQEHNFSAPPPPHQFSEAPPSGNFSAPPPNLPSYNDQSNHSYEERSNHLENYHLREIVHNFDDQTRSSFTMGLNDQDPGFMSNFPKNQMNKPPPSRFGAPPMDTDRGPMRPNFGGARSNDPGFSGMSDDRNRFGPSDSFTGKMPDNKNNFSPNNASFGGSMLGSRNRFGPNDPNFGPGMSDARSRFGPNDPGFGSNMSLNQNKFGGPLRGDSGNYSKNPSLSSGGNNLNKTNEFIRGNDFNDAYSRANIGNKQDTFNSSNFGKEDKFVGGFDNLRRDNFGNIKNFNERGGNFGNVQFNRSNSFIEQNRGGLGKDNYDRNDYDDYDNYNEDEDFEKYHEMFNDEEENAVDVPHHNQRGGPAQNPILGPRQFQSQQFSQRPPQGTQFGQRPTQGPQFGQRPPQDSHPNQRPLSGQRSLIEQRPPQGPLVGQRPPPGSHIGLTPPQNSQFMQKPPALMEVSVVPPQPAPENDVIFEPTTVVEYDHKPLKSPEREVVVEPIHMFDYRHKPLNRIPIPQRPKWLAESVKFIREFDPLASRSALNFERPPVERFSFKSRDIRRDEYIPEDRYGIGSRRFITEPDIHNRGDKRSFGREENRLERESKEVGDAYSRRERRSFSKEKDDERNRRCNNAMYGSKQQNEEDFTSDTKLFSSKDFEDFSDDEMNFENSEFHKHQLTREGREASKSPILSNPPNPANFQDITMIEDLINAPGRFHRPPRIVIILRGPPGSGKTYLAKLIKDKEVENGGSAPRILSLDDYFMVEQEKEVIEDGKKVKVKEMVYEYEAEMEESYRTSFIKSFKKTITDGYFPFIIVDNVNDKVKYFGEMWSFAKQNGFQVYICQLDLDPTVCTKRNVHNRTEAEIEECISAWEPTPSHHPTIDASTFISSIADVVMEEVEQTVEEEAKLDEAPEDEVRSKWDTFDCSNNNLAKLDGVSKPLRPSGTMEDYLQMEDEWEPNKPTKPGQKRVRWADLEEQRQQKKMRAIGFIVGHTNWNRMMDPSEGSSALTQTKYI